MAINFPAAPTEGQKFEQGATLYTFTSGVWNASPLPTALPFNYIVNPCFQISQQNARTTGQASGYYTADQWVGAANNAGSEWMPRFYSNAIVTPNGSQYMLSAAMQFSGSDVAGNYLCTIQNIEGNRIADLKYGTTGAKWSVLSFWVRNQVSRDYTYAVALRNGANNRSISWPLLVPAYPVNAFYYFSFAVPPDTAGTWPKDNSVAMSLSFTTYCNANLRAPAAGVWTAGNYLGVAGMVNDIIVTPGTFLFGDVGLYADPNQTGRAPPWQTPTIRQSLADSQRYWQKQNHVFGLAYSGTTANPGRANVPNYAMMRATPAAAITGSMVCYDVATNPALTGITNPYYSAWGHEANFSAAAGSTTGRASVIWASNANSWISVSARM
jgi:hypothetical protein